MMNFNFFIHNSMVLMFIILYSCRYWVHMCYISIDKFKLSLLKFPCFPRGEHSYTEKLPLQTTLFF